MRRSNWYFHGYQRVEETKKDGRGTTYRLVYTGDWYGFPGGKRQGRAVKWRCALLFLTVLTTFLYAQMRPGVGGRIGWLAAFSLLGLIPLMFEGMALANFLPAGERWEYRVCYAGYKRLWRFGWILEGVLAIWLAVELVLLIQYQLLPVDGWYCLSIAIGLTAQSAMIWTLHKNPVQVAEEAQEGKL